MAKLMEEQIMVGAQMVDRGTSVRQVARQFGVTEGALRYHLRKRKEDPVPDGRRNKPTALAGYEVAVAAILDRFEDRRVTGRGRPIQARVVFDVLVRDYDFQGSYQSVVRHLRRRYGVPPIRAYRRVETPPGVQAQHDWFEVTARIRRERVPVQVLTGVLSHSRARFCWVSQDATQLAWHAGHVALFERYGGVPLWVRIDNLRTGVASGAGPTAVLNASYAVFARELGFEIDPCQAAAGWEKGKAERSVRTFRLCFGNLLDLTWRNFEELQTAFDERSHDLMQRLMCPVTGTPVREAWIAERAVLQPLPPVGELFDVVVSRHVHRDCLISFEGRRYSVPFAWVGRDVEVYGMARDVVVRAGGQEIARHPRRTRQRLLIEPAHFEGPSTDRVTAPPPLGHRGRLQMAGLSSASHEALRRLPEQVGRPLDSYVRLVEAIQ